MLIVQIGEKEYNLKQDASEFTIGEYEKVLSIMEKDTDYVDKYFELFSFLGIEEEILDRFDGFKFLQLIEEYNNLNSFQLKELIQDIEINGRTYRAFDDKFIYTVKDIRLIDRHVKKNPSNYISYIMAIIYKDIDLTKNEHYEDAHIKHKVSLFKDNVTLDYALPYITLYSEKLVNSLEHFKQNLNGDIK